VIRVSVSYLEEAPLKNVSIALVIAAVSATSAYAGEAVSPLFGKAAAHVTTSAQNKSTVGKGQYADYWGYYGNYYSYQAGVYGNAAYGADQGSSINNYYAAYQYSSAATQAYSNAYVYAYYGY
jgi:hypothetical protein